MVTEAPEHHREAHREAARRHEKAASNHDRSAAFWDEHGKHEQAGLQRELAEYERQGAELERRWAALVDPTPAARAASAAEDLNILTSRHAESASVTLSRIADALEESAAIADDPAQRHEEAGSSEGAEAERQIAERAREYAQRARAQASEWRKIADSAST